MSLFPMLIGRAVVVEVGSGALVEYDHPAWHHGERTFYLVALPTEPRERAWAHRQWEAMSREDRSTQARINGQEVTL